VTDDPPDLFEWSGAGDAKRDGMERVAEHADSAWKLAMETAVIATARQMPRFTADDCFVTLYRQNPTPPETHDRRALGPIMLAAAKAGICRKDDATPWIPTRRRSRHAAPLQVWRSLIYNP